MFLKRCTRKKDGKPHTYWQLVESYRTPRGPRHRVAAYLGDMDETERRGWGRLALQLDGKAAAKARQLTLFDHAQIDQDDPEDNTRRADTGLWRCLFSSELVEDAGS